MNQGKIERCNKVFTDPTISPFTGKQVSRRTQGRHLRACKAKLSEGIRFYFDDEQHRNDKDLVQRITSAGSSVVTDAASATLVVSDAQTTSGTQLIMPFSRFKRLYFKDLYTPCERFEKNETQSPFNYVRIEIGSRAHRKWTQRCKGNVKPATITSTTATATTATTATTTLQRIKNMCINEIDPITLERLEDLDEKELKKIVTIGNEKKKHCLKSSSAYDLYAKATKDGREVRNPFNPKHVFTLSEIKKILKITKEKPVVKVPDFVSMRLRFEPLTIQKLVLYRISVASITQGGEYEVYCLGYMPAEVNVSATVMVQLQTMLEKHKIIKSAGELAVHQAIANLRKPIEHWLVSGPLMIERLNAFAAELSRIDAAA